MLKYINFMSIREKPVFYILRVKRVFDLQNCDFVKIFLRRHCMLKYMNFMSIR